MRLETSFSIIALLGFFYCFIPYDLIAYERNDCRIIGRSGLYTSLLHIYGKIEKGTKIFMGDSGGV